LTSPPVNLPREDAVARLRGTLIGPDDATTMVVVAFRPEALPCRDRLVPLIRGALKRYCDVASDEIHFAGSVMDGLSVDRAGRASLDRFAIPSMLITLVVCWYCLR